MSMSPSHTVTDLRVGYPSFCFLHLLYIIMDKLKEDTITHIENFYCQRLTELVDMKMYDEAHAVYEEFAVTSDNEPIEWFFIGEIEDDGSETLSIEDETNR